jgi:hypothetical protein
LAEAHVRDQQVQLQAVRLNPHDMAAIPKQGRPQRLLHHGNMCTTHAIHPPFCSSVRVLCPLQIESILSKKASSGLDASITSYPKQAHGFSLRGDTGDAAVAPAANTAFGAGKAFLDKHLK